MSTEPAGPRPHTYRQDPDGTLVVDWSDGHQTMLTPDRLRAGCPCATCREERLARNVSQGEPGPPAAGFIRLVKVAPVGRYGIAPVWSDGHGTGIYSWTVLRDLCGCLSCRGERGTS